MVRSFPRRHRLHAVRRKHVIPILPVRSKRVEIPLPRTILLAEYVYVAHRVTVTDSSRATFAGVFDRDGRRCAYCAARATTIDHVQPEP